MPATYSALELRLNNWPQGTNRTMMKRSDERTTPDDRKPLVSTNFVISGSFEPDEVTRVMGLEPSSVLRKGARIRTSTKSIPVEDSWWLMTTDECYTFEGTDEVAKAVERLKLLAESTDKAGALS